MSTKYQDYTAIVIVEDVAKIASSHNLLAEVIYSALEYMKKNPKSSIGTAIQMGEGEWIK